MKVPSTWKHAWAFAPLGRGQGTKDVWQTVWNTCLKKGYISHGFGHKKCADVSAWGEDEIKTQFPRKGESICLLRQRAIQPGDLVIARRGDATVLAVGRAQEGSHKGLSYEFEPPQLKSARESKQLSGWWHHCTKVKWLEDSAGPLPFGCTGRRGFARPWRPTIVEVDHERMRLISPYLGHDIHSIVLKTWKHHPPRETPDVDDQATESVSATEGEARLRLHLFRERKLNKRKKLAVLKSEDRLVCEACGFDFSEAYSPYVKAFCEVHHKKPLATLRNGTRISLSDLAILCSNCHRVIHLIDPMPTVKTLRKIVTTARR